jgi:ribosomal-protein-alanine acetyltransferase
VRLRPLRWWDIADIEPLERELFPHDPWPAESFWAELALERERVYLVAEEGAALVGYAGLSCPDPARGADAEIMTLAVAPGAQGRGLGRLLLDALRAVAVDRGAGRILLEVRSDNAAARALYAGAGFDQVALRPGYYRTAGAEPVDALVLRLPLGEPARDVDSVQP